MIPHVMGCMPADINEMIERGEVTGVPLWPGPFEGYQKIQCENPTCGRDMWIGPRQQALDEVAKTSGENMFKVCLICAPSVFDGGVAVHNLGGK